MLDKRLLTAVSLVRKDSFCVDVGTDHGYLPVYLYKNGITKNVTACDVNTKPLQSAEKTIKENGLTGKINLILSNGLIDVTPELAQDIVICGMGGELILEILLACDFVKDESRRFILQPMTNVPLLRQGLYKNGFEIISETPVIDKPHHYTIIYVKYSGVQCDITEVFSKIGKIPESSSTFRDEYIDHIILKETKVVNGLQKSTKDEDKLKYNQKLEVLTELKNIKNKLINRTE